MSQYSRKERNANAGWSLHNPSKTIRETRYRHRFSHVLGAAVFRWGNHKAPLKGGRFSAGKASTHWLGHPVLHAGHKPDGPAPASDYAVEANPEAIPAFDRKIKGYAMKDAHRSGDPYLFTHTHQANAEYESINTSGLYPAGEGAGYAGGILSAAVDGIEVAEAVAQSLVKGS